MTNETYTGADLFVDALEQYGVNHVFGNPGTTELPLMQAFDQSDIDYVLGLHEDVAVGMASGYATTRRYHAEDEEDVNPVGVVNLHTLPGLVHGLGNLYAAKMAGTPLVVTAGNHSTDFRHEEPALSGNLVKQTEQFTKWSAEVLDVSALPTMLRRAFRTALTPPTGPVFLGLPLDMTIEATDERPERLGPIPDAGRGDEAQIERTTDLLVEADEPVFVFGDHVARAGEEAVEAAVRFAEETGARVHGEFLAGEIGFPGHHDQWASFIPFDEELAKDVMDTDTLVFVGCSTNTTLMRHEGRLVGRDTTCIHIGNDAWEVGKNKPADASVVGNVGAIMDELADRVGDRLSEREWSRRMGRTEEVVGEIRDEMTRRTESEVDGDERASKAELVDTLREVVSDPYIVDEGVTSKYVMLNRWPFDTQEYVSNKSGGLGYSLPAALGAAFAERETDSTREVVCFIGDGSYLYYPHSMYTAARRDLDLTVVISDNRNYRILKDNTATILGGDASDYSYTGMDFEPPVDITANAESHGANGHLAETPDELEETLRTALENEGPDVVDALVHD